MAPLVAWLLSDPLDLQKLAFLVFCMVGIHVLSAQLAWRMSLAGAGRGLLAIMWHSWLGRGIARLLRLFYHVGVPLIVLWRGALDRTVVRAMGLATTYVGRWHPGLLLLGLGEPGHAMHLGIGMAIGGAMLGLLLVVWAWYGRVVLEQTGLQEAAIVPALPFWVALREALYLQLLWALYRGVTAMLTGDRLWAAFISLALVALSWTLDPRRRLDLLSARGYVVVQDWLCALFTALLSLTVQVLWFLVVMHTVWMWFGSQALAHLARSGTCQATSGSRLS
ncbi:MAG: hypothetical protein JXA14_13570 [Anaerolineae bacterium]|nr:hypothetical protein [Anaerolineae bacterium]